jgi:hypothetical protein
MIFLTHSEILAELEMLGIFNPSELSLYLGEYTSYYSLLYPQSDSYT